MLVHGSGRSRCETAQTLIHCMKHGSRDQKGVSRVEHGKMQYKRMKHCTYVLEQPLHHAWHMICSCNVSLKVMVTTHACSCPCMAWVRLLLLLAPLLPWTCSAFHLASCSDT